MSALLGHARGTVTSRYVHLVDTALIMAADMIAGHIDALIKWSRVQAQQLTAHIIAMICGFQITKQKNRFLDILVRGNGNPLQSGVSGHFEEPKKDRPVSDQLPNALLELTVDIVSAHVSNNSVAIGDLPTLITKVHHSLASLAGAAEPEPVQQEPAVSVRASVKPDYIICLEDGKKLKMLKRHLMTHFQMTPAEYRAKWNLPANYPMVAPNYAAQRRDLAIKIGLGRKAKAKIVKVTRKPRAAKATLPA